MPAYGMGLEVDRKYGIPIVSHGGSMSGFKSNWYLLPDFGIGAVILTNSDTGGLLEGPFERRLLEILFDGKPEAVADMASRAAAHKAQIAKDRERLVVPAAPDAASAWPSTTRARNWGTWPSLTGNGATIFDLGEWKSHVASRKNDDGTTSFITIDPGTDGFEFVVGDREGKRVLMIRDGQHEYTFREARHKADSPVKHMVEVVDVCGRMLPMSLNIKNEEDPPSSAATCKDYRREHDGRR